MMIKTNTYDEATPAGSTETSRIRSPRAAARQWWRALDRMTLDTMNPPVPAHVRSVRLGDYDDIRADRV